MVYEIREWLRLIENSQEDEKSKIYEEASGNEMQFLIWQGKDGNPVSGRCFLG